MRAQAVFASPSALIRAGALAKAVLKSRKTEASVDAFIDDVKNERQREDSRTLITLMRAVIKAELRLWVVPRTGPSALKVERR